MQNTKLSRQHLIHLTTTVRGTVVSLFVHKFEFFDFLIETRGEKMIFSVFQKKNRMPKPSFAVCVVCSIVGDPVIDEISIFIAQSAVTKRNECKTSKLRSVNMQGWGEGRGIRLNLCLGEGPM